MRLATMFTFLPKSSIVINHFIVLDMKATKLLVTCRKTKEKKGQKNGTFLLVLLLFSNL